MYCVWLRTALSILASDVGLVQVSCLGVGNSGALQYAMRVITFPVVAMLVLSTPCVLQLLRKVAPRCPALSYDHAWNTIRVIGISLCITILTNMFVLIQCTEGPKTPRAMADDRTVTC